MPDPLPQKTLIKTNSAHITRLGEDHIHIDFKNISSVGLENIVDVVNHSINAIFNSTSHLIQFRNGGEVTFVYNNKGHLVDLHATGVNLLLGQNNELIFSIKPLKKSNASPPSP